MLFSRCAFCDNCVGDWEVGDIPLEEHAKLFPMCGFIRGLSVGNISIQSGRFIRGLPVGNIPLESSRLVYQGTSSRNIPIQSGRFIRGLTGGEYSLRIKQVELSEDFQQEYSYTIRQVYQGTYWGEFLARIFLYNQVSGDFFSGIFLQNQVSFIRGLSVGNIPIQSGRFIRGLSVGIFLQNQVGWFIRGLPKGIFLYDQVGLSGDLLGGILCENIPIQSSIRGLPVGNIPIESGQFYQGTFCREYSYTIRQVYQGTYWGNSWREFLYNQVSWTYC